MSEMGWNETRWSYRAERWLHRHHRWVPNFMFGWPTWFGNRKASGIRGIPGDLAYLRDSVLGRSGRVEPTSLSELPVRDLTEVERALLEAMFSLQGLDGATEYRRQAVSARAAPWPIGDGSIYLVTERGMDPLTDVSSPIVEGDVLSEDGRVIAGLLLFQYNGWLHCLEIYPFDDTPVPLPPVDRARLRLFSG